MNPVDQHRWKQRVLIFSAASPSHVGYRKQEQNLSKGKRGIKERDLVIFRLYDDHWIGSNGEMLTASQAELIRASYGISKGSFQVLLVGKDGGVKMRRNDVVEMREIFSLIDSMPMRKREMKEKDGFKGK